MEQGVRAGGPIQHGWTIWEWQGVYVEAEFHACWRAPNGTLHDLTPKALPVDRILFLPDNARSYQGRQVNNVHRPISSLPAVAEFIAAADAEFEFMNRGARAEQRGAIGSAKQRRENTRRSERRGRGPMAIRNVWRNAGRNNPCPCGSGRKFKRCHGA